MTLPLNRRAGAVLTSLPALAALVLPGTFAPTAHARPGRHGPAASGCAYAGLAARRTPRETLKQAVVCLINRQRVAHGLPRLLESSDLDRSAQGWSSTMVRTRRFDHGPGWPRRISATGFKWSRAGENIATGYATPRGVVDAWMRSAGHCENILDPRFTRVGTGVVDRGVPRYASGGGTWTQDFALPRDSRAPSSDWGPAARCPYR